MEKIINKKRYNSDTAEHIGHESYGFRNDFYAWEEDLYKTKKGQYFLVGSGGALTKYAISHGNNSTGGSEELHLLTKEEAIAWLQVNDNEALSKHFANIIEEG